ncbi:MAG: GNAT family N-acetyltransferase [Dehalococcoidia bacterium]
MTSRSVRFDGTGLFYRVTDPADERLDMFEPGSTDCAQEEASYFQARAWTGALDGRECACLQLVTKADEVIGYLAYDIVLKPHPSRRSKTEVDYLFLYHLWIAPEYQGERDSHANGPIRWSVQAMRLVESLAATLGCIGVYLNVRLDNGPALRLYRGLGYVDDGSYTARATNHQMLRMRKVLG